MSNRQGVAWRLIDAVAEENLVELREILFHKKQQRGGEGVDAVVFTDDDIDQALLKASSIGNVEAFDLLFNNGLSESAKEKYRNEENPTDYFPLHWSALRSHPEMVKFMVQDCQYNTNQLDFSGVTALFWAYNCVETSRVLLENGADPNRCGRNKWRNHPLFRALYLSNYEVVRLLLEHGADPNFQRRPEAYRHGYGQIFDRPVADQAIVEANPERLTLLLQYGAILGVPLGSTEIGGAPRIIQMLTSQDRSPEKKLSICQVLAEHAKSNNGNVKEYIQHHVDQVICTFDTCFGEAILQSGVIPSSQIMHTAVQEGKVSICRLLVQNGVNPFQQENDNAVTLFQTAASRENTDVFELFLDLWDDGRFSSTTHGGSKSSMHVVCGFSDVSLQAIQLLIERQGHTLMTVDRHQQHGLRPFLISSMRGAKLDVIYTLLRQNPDALGRSR